LKSPGGRSSWPKVKCSYETLVRKNRRSDKPNIRMVSGDSIGAELVSLQVVAHAGN
jgi:hypothetical protein